MERVDQFEPLEDVVVNRLRIRKYLRELLMNSKRIDEIIAINTTKTEEEAINEIEKAVKNSDPSA